MSCLQAQATSDVTMIIPDGDVAANGATDGSRTMSGTGPVTVVQWYQVL